MLHKIIIADNKHSGLNLNEKKNEHFYNLKLYIVGMKYLFVLFLELPMSSTSRSRIPQVFKTSWVWSVSWLVKQRRVYKTTSVQINEIIVSKYCGLIS